MKVVNALVRASARMSPVLARVRKPPQRPSARHRRPLLEVLEDRTVLSTGDFDGTSIPMTLTNNTNPFAADQIYLAVYGEVTPIPMAGVPPAPGLSYYLDATQLNPDGTPLPQPATGLPLMSAATPNTVQLPSSTLAQWTTPPPGMTTPVLALPVPADGMQYTGRIVISAGAPVQAQVNNEVNNDPTTRSVAAPAASNPTDTSTGTFYDFLEFTVTNPTTGPTCLDIDTSLVDSFGIPLTVQFTYLDTMMMTQTAGPVGVNQPRSVVMSAGSAGPLPNLNFQGFLATKEMTNGKPVAQPFEESFTASTAAAGTRLVSPKDVIESHFNDSDYSTNYLNDPLNTYFDSTFKKGKVAQLGILDQFFLNYTPPKASVPGGKGKTLVLTSSNGTAYQGKVMQITQVVNGTPTTYWVLRFTNATDPNTYDVYYPYFQDNTYGLRASAFYPTPGTAPAAPPAVTATGLQKESPSGMVFACDGVFNTATGVLGDFENEICAALNRGVALNPPVANQPSTATWCDSTRFYDASTTTNSGRYNYWVQYWHQPGLNAGTNNQAYAFPYDDQCGNLNFSTNLQQDNPQQVTIALGSWGTGQATTTALTAIPSPVNPGQPATLTATVAAAGGPAPTGTVTFFIDGVAVNSMDAGPDPAPQPVSLVGGVAQLTAVLPALPDGAHTHTFTVTAVYSGDANNLPSVGSGPLQLTGVSGIPLTFNAPTPPSAPNGSMVTFTAAYGLPLTGTIDFSIYDNTNAILYQDLGQASFMNGAATLAATINIPAKYLPKTGSLAVTIRATYLGTPAGNSIIGFTVTVPGRSRATSAPPAGGPGSILVADPGQLAGQVEAGSKRVVQRFPEADADLAGLQGFLVFGDRDGDGRLSSAEVAAIRASPGELATPLRGGYPEHL